MYNLILCEIGRITLSYKKKPRLIENIVFFFWDRYQLLYPIMGYLKPVIKPLFY